MLSALAIAPAAAQAQGGAITAGDSHACALNPTGTVKCWGAGTLGQLGDGRRRNSSVPVQVSGVTSAISVSAGGDHTCAILADRTAMCWGSNAFGELGNGHAANTAVPVAVAGLTNVSSIAPAYGATCAAQITGAVWCWGDGSGGELGNGPSVKTALVPKRVPGLDQVDEITASPTLSTGDYEVGGSHFCTHSSDLTVACWGDNEYAQLGVAKPTYAFTPVSAPEFSPSTTVTASADDSCVIKVDAAVLCSGGGSRETTPVPVTGVTDAEALGTDCALNHSGAVDCFEAGPFSASDDPNRVRPPSLIPGIADATAIASGALFSCVTTGSSQILCWGEGDSGQLGDGRAKSSKRPVEVSASPKGAAVDLYVSGEVPPPPRWQVKWHKRFLSILGVPDFQPSPEGICPASAQVTLSGVGARTATLSVNVTTKFGLCTVPDSTVAVPTALRHVRTLNVTLGGPGVPKRTAHVSARRS